MPADGYPIGRVRDVLQRVRRTIVPEVGQIYNLVGVRLYAAGARIQGSFDGGALQAPTLSRIESSDIIYNKMWASKGTFALITAEIAPCYGTSEYPSFRPRDDNCGSFYFQVLSQPRFWQRAEAWSAGSTDRTRLNPGDFLLLPVPLPKPAEQRAISEILNAMTAAIDGTEMVIEAVTYAKRATMRELLTGGIRRSKAPLKKLSERWVLGRIAEGATHIPADWGLVTLSKFARLESGHTPSRDKPAYWGGNVPWISLADTDALGALTIHATAECVTSEGITNSSARVLPAGTVVFSRTATVGKATRMARKMATSQDFANWICGPKLLPSYLVQVFRHMDREWERLQEGSTHKTIYMPVFKKLQILLPSLAEQKKIAAIGEAFDTRIESERVALTALKSNRAALAQELLSGRLAPPAGMVKRYRTLPEKAE